MSENEPKTFMLHSEQYGDFEIALEVNAYAYGGNLAVMMRNRDADNPNYFEPFMDGTVNIEPCGYLENTVNVNDYGFGVAKFLEENGIAEPTGKRMASGFVVYPVYKFNEDVLKECDPKGFATYEKAQLERLEVEGLLGRYPELVAHLEEDLGIAEGRKPGELKSAGKAPEQVKAEKATPTKDEAAAVKSAAARGADAPAREVTRQR